MSNVLKKYYWNALIKRLKQSNLFKDSFWAILGNIASKGLTLVTGIIVARLLGNEIYGEYGMVKNPLMSSAMFLTLGLGYTSTRFIAQYKTRGRSLVKKIVRFSNYVTIGFSGLIALFIFIFSKQIAQNFLHAIHLSNALKIVAVWIVLYTITINQTGIIAGLNGFKKLAFVNGIIGVVTMFVTLFFTYYLNLEGALLALIVVHAVNVVLLKRIIDKTISSLAEDNHTTLNPRIIFKTTIPVALQEGVFSIFGWLNGYIIITLSTYSEYGLYTAAMQWNAIILFIPGILRNVILSHLSNEQDSNKHNSILKRITLFNIVLTIIPSLVAILLSDYISMLYGQSFKNLGELISIAVITTVFMSVSNVYAQAYMSKDKNWTMLFIRIGRATLATLITYLLLAYTTKFNGAKAIIISTLAIYITSTITMVLIYHFKIDKFNFKGVLNEQ